MNVRGSLSAWKCQTIRWPPSIGVSPKLFGAPLEPSSAEAPGA